MPRLRSLRFRLVLLFFAITAGAVGIVYLYIVPQLSSQLTADKLDRLRAVAAREGPNLEERLAGATDPRRLSRIVNQAAERSDARATLLGIRSRDGEPAPDFVVADSTSESSATLPRYEVATAALASREPATGVETVAGARTGQAAVALEFEGRPAWVLVLASPLDEVGDSVSLIRRQIVIAGLIALAAAALAGYWASRSIARRLRRLEEAAGRLSEGDFSRPVPVDSADELGALAEAFNAMQERLGRLDLARKEFIANASHELRTPIFSLGGFAELIDDEDLDRETRAEFVAAIREQVDRMKKLAAELLDLSKLDADALELNVEEIDLHAIAQTVAAEFLATARAHESRLTVTRGGTALATGDRDRVSQIVRILLDNALTHTPSGTRISITAGSPDGGAHLTVRDSGPGIEPAARGRVFERFFSASARGSGLGLAIASELAARMGGELTVESRAGRTEFRLSLPEGSHPGSGRPATLTAPGA